MPLQPRSALAALALCALFTAAPALAQFNTNLVVNPGAEAALGGDGSSSFAGNLPGWDVTGEMMGIAYAAGCPQGYPCAAPTNPGPQAAGLNHFAGGNVAASTAVQTVNLSFAASTLATSSVQFTLSGWLGGYAAQNDNMTLTLTWFNPLGTALGSTTLGPVTAAERGNTTGLLLRESSGLVPTGSVAAQLTLAALRVGGGSSNDGYADNLALVLSPVPEPATAGLLGLGLLALTLRRRRSR